MNNEPVAWMYQIHDITGWTWVIDQRLPDYEYRNEKPLYTHPVKTLTDEEILNVAFCCEVHTVSIENDWDGTVIDFARAILKKASEKC